MTTINLSWNTVAGAYGYRIHAGQVSGLYTEVSSDIAAATVPDVAGNTKAGSITVPTSGTWYVAVAGYDVSGYEGLYSTPQPMDAGSGSPPVGVPVLSVR